MLIIIFIMLNQIQLKLNGLYIDIEEDIEKIDDGIQRFMNKGDIKAVEQEKVKRSHMDLENYFISAEEQH